MDFNEVKKRLQGHFTDGLVTIVGSGLSVAAGLPGMKELAEHLLKAMDGEGQGDVQTQWKPIREKLAAGMMLEIALKDVDVGNVVLDRIVNVTARFVESREREVLQRIYRDDVKLPFAGLLPHLSFNSDRISVITTNYDRLIEFAAEIAGLGIDTLFPGQYYGEFDPGLSKEALWTGKQTQKRNNIKRVYRKHVVVLKPHGSLDWFSLKGRPVRCTVQIDAPRLMITPGQNKYRMGYERPFDQHREAANRAIDDASRLLIIGYGFNDDQLETHLRPKIQKGTPCVVLTKDLSENGQKLVKESKSILGICSYFEGEKECSKVLFDGRDSVLPGLRAWDLDDFVKEVLK